MARFESPGIKKATFYNSLNVSLTSLQTDVFRKLGLFRFPAFFSYIILLREGHECFNKLEKTNNNKTTRIRFAPRVYNHIVNNTYPDRRESWVSISEIL